MASEIDGDPFDSLLSLEDQYYNEGYEQGVADGSRAGRIEGRIFGLEKGFEKFVSMGKLHGRAAIWHARLSTEKELGKNVEHATKATTEAENEAHEKIDGTLNESSPGDTLLLPLPKSQRLQRHIDTLSALSEPVTFSTQNDEDSVADFDDRLKRAEAKARLIVNMMGETDGSQQRQPSASGASLKRRVTLKRDDTVGDRNIEDFGSSNARNRTER